MKKIALLVALSAFALASGDKEVDYIPRLVNFIIFAAIVWHFVGDKIKTFYKDRKEKIAQEFQSVQDKLRESKKNRDVLKQKVEESHKKAEEMITTAKKEAVFLKEKILENAQKDTEVIKKQFVDFQEFETRKMKRETVKEFMNKLTSGVNLNSEKISSVIVKKVG